MPRQPRKKSESGIYHIMLRGINQQTIFENAEDYDKFLEILRKFRAICGYKIYAYCLMSNHVHLLLKEEKEEIDLIMKRISCSYVYWYNWKYKRCGHLFHDRFRSEPVENDEYFLTVIRYIHQNPIKAGLCKSVNEYKHSSYNEYISFAEVVETKFCLEMMGKEQFIDFNNMQTQDFCLDIENLQFRTTDEEAKQIIKKISKCNTPADFQNLSQDKRNKFLKKMREKGLSIRQITRLTGISFDVVRKF